LHRGLGNDRCRPGAAVDRRQLTEEVPRHDRADAAAAPDDLGLALEHHEQRLAETALFDQALARIERELVRLPGEALQRPFQEIREERNALEGDDALPLHPRGGDLRPAAADRPSFPEQGVGAALTHTRSLAGLEHGRRNTRGAGRTVTLGRRWTCDRASKRPSPSASCCSTARGGSCCRGAASPRRTSAAIGSATTRETSRAIPTC